MCMYVCVCVCMCVYDEKKIKNCNIPRKYAIMLLIDFSIVTYQLFSNYILQLFRSSLNQFVLII